MEANDESVNRAKKLKGNKQLTLRHDVSNQLSNIYLAIDQLRYELPENMADSRFYLDVIFQSANNINALLKELKK
jgi:hypothetical protein